MAMMSREEWLDFQEEKGYKSYERWYERQERIVERHGEAMKSRKLDYGEWLEMRNELRDDFKREVELGKRKGVGNVNQYIARSQAYDVSYKSALNIRKAIKDREGIFGEGAANVSIFDIMAKNEEAKEAIFDVLRDEYHRLTEMEGLKPSEAKKEISRRYFGSK